MQFLLCNRSYNSGRVMWNSVDCAWCMKNRDLITELKEDADQLYGALSELYHCVCSGGDVDEDTNDALIEARKAFLRHEEIRKKTNEL